MLGNVLGNVLSDVLSDVLFLSSALDARRAGAPSLRLPRATTDRLAPGVLRRPAIDQDGRSFDRSFTTAVRTPMPSRITDVIRTQVVETPATDIPHATPPMRITNPRR